MVFRGQQLKHILMTGRARRALASFAHFSIAIIILLTAQPGVGQPSSVGSDFQINAITFDSQANSDATKAGDHFVVTWRGAAKVNSQTRRLIYLRMLGRDGQFLTEDSQVNTYMGEGIFQTNPRVAGHPNGFVIAWESEDSSTFIDHVRVRAFHADGTPYADDFKVNLSTAEAQNPDIAATSNGRFLVVWGRTSTTPGVGDSVHGRILLPDGTPLADDFDVSTVTTSHNWFPSVSASPAGEFFVTWAGGDGDFHGVKMRRVSAYGTLLAQEFLVNSYTTGPQDWATTAFSSAGEPIVFFNSGWVGGTNVWARRLAPGGAPVATEFQIAQSPAYSDAFPAAAFDGEDNALVVWQKVFLGPEEVGGQILSSDGTLLPADFIVNTYTTGAELLPSIAGPLADGTMLVTWYSRGSPGDDNDDSSVKGRLFRGAPPPPPLAPARIPTLGHLGLVAFALLLALAALRVVRR